VEAREKGNLTYAWKWGLFSLPVTNVLTIICLMFVCHAGIYVIGSSEEQDQKTAAINASKKYLCFSLHSSIFCYRYCLSTYEISDGNVRSFQTASRYIFSTTQTNLLDTPRIPHPPLRSFPSTSFQFIVNLLSYHLIPHGLIYRQCR
jgi:hypothetical protein